MSADLTIIPARQLVGLMRAREISPVEVASAFFERIERFNPQINAVVCVSKDWREQAERAELLLLKDTASAGALCGLPLTVKDTIDIAGLPTTAGAIARSDMIATEDAPVVRRLREAGAIIIGKTNTSELALDYESNNPLFGRTNNPHDIARSPGGSSGGEAAAQAARFAAAGVGSDMVGSLRVPAHCCAVASLKSTTDKLPAEGHFPRSAGAIALSSTIGFIARTTDDLALLFEAVTNTSAHIESASEKRLASDVLINGDLAAARVAYCFGEFAGVGVSADVSETIKTAARACEDLVASVERDYPSAFVRGTQLWGELFGRAVAPQVLETYADREDLAGAAASEMLEREKRLQMFDETAWREAKAERDRLRAEVLRWFSETHVLLAPVGSVSATVHGARKVMFADFETGEAQTVGLFRAYSFTHVANVFDLPSVTVPVGLNEDELPCGVQLIGAPGSERLLLAVAGVIEDSCGGYRAPRSFN